MCHSILKNSATELQNRKKGNFIAGEENVGCFSTNVTLSCRFFPWAGGLNPEFEYNLNWLMKELSFCTVQKPHEMVYSSANGYNWPFLDMLISWEEICLWLIISSAISRPGLLPAWRWRTSGDRGQGRKGCLKAALTEEPVLCFWASFRPTAQWCKEVLETLAIQEADHNKCEQGLKCTAGYFWPLLYAFVVAGKQFLGAVHPCMMEPFVVMF